jgi:uncharacterized protein
MELIMGIVLSIAVVLSVLWFNRYKVRLGLQILITMLVGIISGVVFKEAAIVFETVGLAFISLLKMLVIPLVFTTLISSIVTIKDTLQLKRIGVKTIGLFLLTAVLASSIGIVVAKLINPGKGIILNLEKNFEGREVPTFNEVFLNFMPSNPIENMANGEIIPIVLFSVLIGVALLTAQQRNIKEVAIVITFFNGLSKTFFQLTNIIIRLSPIGVFGLMANTSSSYGLDTLIPLILLVITVYIACLIHVIFTYGSLIGFVGRVNPLGFFYRSFPAMAVAFTTRSSYGTLPVTINVITKKLKISKKIANFVAPLGATINMDACGGIYPAIVAVFVSSVYGIELTVIHYILIVLTATIASVGTAGVPGTASIMATVVLSSAGLPIEGLALVLAIDAILDMARTSVNVTGDMVVSFLVGKSEKEWKAEEY